MSNTFLLLTACLSQDLQNPYIFQQLTSSSKLSYEQSLTHSYFSKPKKLYNYISYLSTHDSISETIVLNSTPVNMEKVTTFNIFFNSILHALTLNFYLLKSLCNKNLSYIYKELKKELGLEKYLNHVHGAHARLFFRFR